MNTIKKILKVFLLLVTFLIGLAFMLFSYTYIELVTGKFIPFNYGYEQCNTCFPGGGCTLLNCSPTKPWAYEADRYIMVAVSIVFAFLITYLLNKLFNKYRPNWTSSFWFYKNRKTNCSFKKSRFCAPRDNWTLFVLLEAIVLGWYQL